MTESKYTIELKGPGLNLKREITEAFATDLLIWLVKGEKSPPHSVAARDAIPLELQKSPHQAPSFVTSTATNHAVSSYGQFSVREFMEKHSPGRGPDKIACFALYLQEYRNKPQFSKPDIIALFQEAAEPLPKNLGRDIQWARTIAWIAQVHTSRDSYYLTNKGIEAVRGNFSKEIISKTKLASAIPKKRASSGLEESSSDQSPKSPRPQ